MASVPFTTWRCPAIQQLEGDFFIPRTVPAEAQDAADTLDRDRVLREFWAERSNNP